jgi:hypothetical protein
VGVDESARCADCGHAHGTHEYCRACHRQGKWCEDFRPIIRCGVILPPKSERELYEKAMRGEG